jgi:hypothetical protein
MTRPSPLIGATAVRVPTMSSAGRARVQGGLGGPMAGSRRPSYRHQPAETDQGLGLGVQPWGLVVVVEMDAQHGLDTALVVHHQPTQGLLVCRDDHPLDPASRQLTAASLVGDLTSGEATSLQEEERQQMMSLD